MIIQTKPLLEASCKLMYMSLNGLKFLNVNLVWGTYREEAHSKMGQLQAIALMQLKEFCPTSPHAGKQGVKPEIKLKFHSPYKAGGFHLLIVIKCVTLLNISFIPSIL